MAITDYNYPNIEPTDYIDESLDKILARDDASKCGFRRVETFPIVSEKDVGMKVYLSGRGNFQLISVDPEPFWKQLTVDNRNPAYIDWVQENYQPLSALLTSFARLNQAANALAYFNGPNDMQATPISQYMRGILSQNDAATLRTALGLGDASTLNLPLDGATTIAPGSIPVSAISDDFKRNMGWTTGDIKLTYKNTADDGWVILDDGSIGNQASGATTRANADTRDLFLLMWNLPVCTVETFAGVPSSKTTAVGDWNANKRLVLPKILGRTLGVAGSGDGLTTRSLGGNAGAEQTLSDVNIPPHSHAGMQVYSTNIAYDNSYSRNQKMWGSPAGGAGDGAPAVTATVPSYYPINWESKDTYDFTRITNKQGNKITQQTFTNIQPTTFVNVMIKL